MPTSTPETRMRPAATRNNGRVVEAGGGAPGDTVVSRCPGFIAGFKFLTNSVTGLFTGVDALLPIAGGFAFPSSASNTSTGAPSQAKMLVIDRQSLCFTHFAVRNLEIKYFFARIGIVVYAVCRLYQVFRECWLPKT